MNLCNTTHVKQTKTDTLRFITFEGVVRWSNAFRKFQTQFPQNNIKTNRTFIPLFVMTIPKQRNLNTKPNNTNNNNTNAWTSCNFMVRGHSTRFKISFHETFIKHYKIIASLRPLQDTELIQTKIRKPEQTRKHTNPQLWSVSTHSKTIRKLYNLVSRTIYKTIIGSTKPESHLDSHSALHLNTLKKLI